MEPNPIFHPHLMDADCEKSVKAQTLMIQKIHPDYDPNTDYVLWLVPDLLNKYEPAEITGRIYVNAINKQLDNRIANQIRHPIIRKPYPNKIYTQLSSKNGNKRSFGIPLVFKTLDDLKNIASLLFHWEIVTPTSYDIVQAGYTLSFALNDEYSDAKMFTLSSKTGIQNHLSDYLRDTLQNNFTIIETTQKVDNTKANRTVYSTFAKLIAYPTAGIIPDTSFGFARV